jgi:hypothetical protein
VALNRGEFPPLLLLRRYLKLAIEFSVQGKLMALPLGEAVGLPFDLAAMPHRFSAPGRHPVNWCSGEFRSIPWTSERIRQKGTFMMGICRVEDGVSPSRPLAGDCSSRRYRLLYICLWFSGGQ